MDVQNIQPHGINLSNLETLGQMIERLAKETRRSYATGNYDNAIKWLDAVNEKCFALNLRMINIDFKFIDRVRLKK
jgi:hypothetical protein